MITHRKFTRAANMRMGIGGNNCLVDQKVSTVHSPPLDMTQTMLIFNHQGMIVVVSGGSGSVGIVDKS